MSADFDVFWDDVDRDLARYPVAPELEPLPMRSSDSVTTWAVRLTSLGPYRIFAYYSEPAGGGPFPGLLLTPRYGSVNNVPDYGDRERYAVLQVVHRGQRLADEPFAAAYPGLLTQGIDQPKTFIYRAIVADCLRGAEFLLSRAEVDRGCIGVRGDDLALLTAARRPAFKVLHAAELLLYRLLDATERTDAYPVEEVGDYLRAFPERREAVRRTLAYFEPQYHAPQVRAACLLATGDDGAVGGPEWLQPLRSALGERAEEFRMSHRGAVDQDWIDAWFAGQLGTRPRSRFREPV